MAFRMIAKVILFSNLRGDSNLGGSVKVLAGVLGMLEFGCCCALDVLQKWWKGRLLISIQKSMVLVGGCCCWWCLIDFVVVGGGSIDFVGVDPIAECSCKGKVSVMRCNKGFT